MVKYIQMRHIHATIRRQQPNKANKPNKIHTIVSTCMEIMMAYTYCHCIGVMVMCLPILIELRCFGGTLEVPREAVGTTENLGKVLVIDSEESRTSYIEASPDCKFIIWVNQSKEIMINGEVKATHEFVLSRSLLTAGKSNSVYYWATDDDGFAIFSVDPNKSSKRITPSYPRLALREGISGKTPVGLFINFGVKHTFISRQGNTPPGNTPEGWFAISPDGSRIIYVLVKDIQASEYEIIVDGKSQGIFETIWRESIRFSQDGKRLTYACKDNSGWRVYIDGKLGEPWDSVSTPVFSADGGSHAYLAQKGNKVFVVFNSNAKRVTGDSLKDRTIAVSTNGDNVAYTVKVGNNLTVYENEKAKGQHYDNILGITYTPQDELCVTVQRDGHRFIVIGGEEQRPYQRIWNALFSPDGKHIAYIAQKSEDKKRICVIDGNEIGDFDAILYPGYLDDTCFRYICIRGRKIYSVEHKLSDF